MPILSKRTSLPLGLLLVGAIIVKGETLNAEGLENAVPNPPGEQNPASEFAKNWVTSSPENNILEGAIFDAEGNLSEIKKHAFDIELIIEIAR